MRRLVINGEEIYELDEECLKEKRRNQEQEKRCHILEERQIKKSDFLKEQIR